MLLRFRQKGDQLHLAFKTNGTLHLVFVFVPVFVFVFAFTFIFLRRMSWLWQVVVKSNFELDFKSLLSSALNFQLVGPFISTMGQRVNKLGKVHCKTLIHQTL